MRIRLEHCDSCDPQFLSYGFIFICEPSDNLCIVSILDRPSSSSDFGLFFCDLIEARLLKSPIKLKLINIYFIFVRLSELECIAAVYRDTSYIYQ